MTLLFLCFSLLQGLLPRGEKPNPLRQKNAKVNQLLKISLPKLANVQLLDTDGGFVHSGQVPRDPDAGGPRPGSAQARSPRGHTRLLRGSSSSRAGKGETCTRRVPTAAEARRPWRREQRDPYSGGRRRRQRWSGRAGGGCGKNTALPTARAWHAGQRVTGTGGVVGEERSPAAAGTRGPRMEGALNLHRRWEVTRRQDWKGARGDTD